MLESLPCENRKNDPLLTGTLTIIKNVTIIRVMVVHSFCRWSWFVSRSGILEGTNTFVQEMKVIWYVLLTPGVTLISSLALSTLSIHLFQALL